VQINNEFSPWFSPVFIWWSDRFLPVCSDSDDSHLITPHQVSRRHSDAGVHVHVFALGDVVRAIPVHRHRLHLGVQREALIRLRVNPLRVAFTAFAAHRAAARNFIVARQSAKCEAAEALAPACGSFNSQQQQQEEERWGITAGVGEAGGEAASRTGIAGTSEM
jgi:hypothetical protein